LMAQKEFSLKELIEFNQQWQSAQSQCSSAFFSCSNLDFEWKVETKGCEITNGNILSLYPGGNASGATANLWFQITIHG